MSYNEDRYVDRWKLRFVGISKKFSANFNIDQLPQLLLRKRLTFRQTQIIRSMYDALEKFMPNEYEFNFTFVPKFRRHINTYGRVVGGFDTFMLPDGMALTEIRVVLHYPEITIRNERGATHLIRDLFVSFFVTWDENDLNADPIFRFVNGSRSTYTLLEYWSNFVHSHLFSRSLADSSQGKLDFDDFCVGSSDMMSTMSLLCENYSDEMFELLIFQIENFVSWESLEGGPYRQIAYIDKIGEAINTSVDEGVSQYDFVSAYNLFTELVKEDQIKIDLDYRVLRRGSLGIIADNKFNQMFEHPLFKSAFPHLEVVYDPVTGKYRKPVKLEIPERLIDNRYSIKFRDRVYPFTIIVTDECLNFQNRPVETTIHPSIKNHVRSKLQESIPGIQIADTAIRRLNQSNYPR